MPVHGREGNKFVLRYQKKCIFLKNPLTFPAYFCKITTISAEVTENSVSKIVVKNSE